MLFFRRTLPGLLAVGLGMMHLAGAASLVEATNFGSNPGGIQMYIYVPDKLASKPPIITAIHPCGGSASEYYSLTQLPSYADSLGFILIYPQTTKYSDCWDYFSSASLTHNGGGDSEGIVQMVNYTLNKYNGDPTKVFSTGSSSGAMMTPILLAAYPDVFAAGAGFSGVPAGCWQNATSSTPSTPDQSCPHAQKDFTPQEWGNLAREEDPGWTGTYPGLQVWEGTADTLVYIGNLQAQLDQWSNLLGLAFSHNETNNPQSGYTKIVYGDGTRLAGYSGAGVGHFVPYHEVQVLEFFGLYGSTGTSSTASVTGPSTTAVTGPTPTTRMHTTTTAAPTTGGGGCTQSLYGQCGGIGYSGCTACASGSTCHDLNAYYYQCLS